LRGFQAEIIMHADAFVQRQRLPHERIFYLHWHHLEESLTEITRG
jgi:hypothetical protein